MEYEVTYHAHYIKRMMERPFVAGAALWNLVDFNSEGRAESTPHINTKGITTETRDPKESLLFIPGQPAENALHVKLGGNQWALRCRYGRC
jgi:beta-galactosidase